MGPHWPENCVSVLHIIWSIISKQEQRRDQTIWPIQYDWQVTLSVTAKTGEIIYWFELFKNFHKTKNFYYAIKIGV